MKYDHIEINGTAYRVEFNWNAIGNFLDSEEITLEQVDNLKSMRPRQVTSLVYAGVCEGCRIEATPFPFTREDFGAMIGPEEIKDLLTIYNRHVSNRKETKVVQADDSAKKKTRQFFR